MNQYQCMTCGRTYNEPCKQYDDIGYPHDVCPYCESNEWERVTICDKCGNPGNYLEKYCETCKTIIKNAITGQIDLLVQTLDFDRAEVGRVLAEIVEGE